MENLKFSFVNSILISSFSVFLYFFSGHYLMRDGFTDIEFGLLSLIYGLIIFLVTILFVLIRVPYFLKDALPKWYHITILHFCLILILSFGLDSFYHYIIDDRLAKTFADSLDEILVDNEDNNILIKMYSNMSPFLQNYITIIISVAIALLISIPIAFKLGRSNIKS